MRINHLSICLGVSAPAGAVTGNSRKQRESRQQAPLLIYAHLLLLFYLPTLIEMIDDSAIAAAMLFMLRAAL